MNRNKFMPVYWTKERVRNGLLRFIRDFYEDRPQDLPWNHHVYRIAVPEDQSRRARRLRLYPTYDVVARHYESMIAAWADLGFIVQPRALEYWTQDEVINGLKRFHADFNCCPTYHGYLEKSQFSTRFGKDGKEAPRGAYGKHPSFPVIRKFFASMREAWTAAGFDVNQWWEPWTPLEDWFILESVGVLPRKEVSELMKRTEPAIKRRLYDLGRINSRNRWGISVNRAANMMGIGGHVVIKYLEYGIIPFYRGNKQMYLNPADLLKIKEIDWTLVNPELEKLIRRSIIHRITKILAYRENWRAREIYTFQKTKNYLAGRIKNPRQSAFAKGLPEAPNDLKEGDWVTLKIRVRQVSKNRKGIIRGVFYSPQKKQRPDGTKRECWIANVEFPKIKRFTLDGENRVRYNLPLDVLEKSAKPEVEPVPLKTNADAVRSRNRRAQYEHRAGERLQEIKQNLT